MGFDLVLRIRLHLDLIALLELNKKRIEEESTLEWQQGLEAARIFFEGKYSELLGSSLYLDRKTGYLELVDWSNDLFGDHASAEQYGDYVLYFLILELLATGAEDEAYKAMFGEDSEVEDGELIVSLESYSSYKGGEELDIDYEQIARDIQGYRAKYPHLRVTTTLSID